MYVLCNQPYVCMHSVCVCVVYAVFIAFRSTSFYTGAREKAFIPIAQRECFSTDLMLIVGVIFEFVPSLTQTCGFLCNVQFCAMHNNVRKLMESSILPKNRISAKCNTAYRLPHLTVWTSPLDYAIKKYTYSSNASDSRRPTQRKLLLQVCKYISLFPIHACLTRFSIKLKIQLSVLCKTPIRLTQTSHI